jgi:hypothetical protein
MLYRIAADGLVLFHLSFILFVVFGGLLVLKWRCLVWWHLPRRAVGYGGGVLPPALPAHRLGNRLRHAAGKAAMALVSSNITSGRSFIRPV